MNDIDITLFKHSLVKLGIDLLIAAIIIDRVATFIIFEHYMRYFEVKVFAIIFVFLLFVNICSITGKRGNNIKIITLSISIAVCLFLLNWVITTLKSIPTRVDDFIVYFSLYVFIFILLAISMETIFNYLDKQIISEKAKK